MMDLGKDPPSPPSRIQPSCKELFHWYFLFVFRSRKLRVLAVSLTGRSRRVVRNVMVNCGDMALCLPIFQVFPMECTFVVSAVPNAAQSIVYARTDIFAAFVPASARSWPAFFAVAARIAGVRTFPVAANVSGGAACNV